MVKGTVTSLSSIFAPDDALKASVHVQEVISQRQKEVQQLQAFLNDNTSLVNLLKKLPDQLHHDIMVPFGKAAFFPGKLIHTNEFMVLLGEGYYAERTSKQTVEILKRRGKGLDSQIESLNAVIKDLKFETSFFDETATEAAEGIVEIREDYVEEAFDEDKATTSGQDDFASILSRIDQLEKEELESELAEEGEEKDEADIEPEFRNLEIKESLDIPVYRDSHIKVPTPSGSNTPMRPVDHNISKEGLSRAPMSRDEVEVSTLASSSSNASSKTSVAASGSSNASSKTSVAASMSKEVSNFGSRSSNDKAFTGSIVERTHNIENSQKGQTSAPASKPVSRFKLQRK
ncbi:RNA polymerase II subunit 5-mediating protein homolog isoform X2 [Helianthus annuus]|uniref:RNA polymerase II subunit 5-mediating protein homolog isoform X2 n=1 Tax=Helianthus annuus TaxID=4232 RepID=UPI001652CCB2|nr:RNA polymerase II subunit 5-mediating protein homolog isoform X2 [Helianthus annuus]